ncbi:aromatic aminobenezylarsenical efflux permease ArsG family transporter [Porphyromonas pogonae]|uniref:aromatic aminobenezylarsenical efflux permease ArsG family transporter n=1 Tax=Porphyromonas pogonae TaxID=867595 RepID=UPI002E78C46D|nr:aromatic aminobenezylarsenical efflux permease ArsG family transporter [Porphyromonas pogonae]
MEFLQNLVDSSNIPLFTAFILGIMTAISPCPLAMNITATAYLSKDITHKRKVLFNGIFYTLGRMFSYTALASLIFFGASKFHIARWFQQIDGIWIGIAFIVIGILMLDFIKLSIPFLSNWTSQLSKKQNKRNYWSAFLLGTLFALAFCPYGGMLYFGALIPLTITSSEGLLLPPIYSIATGLPVIIIAFLLAFSVANIGTFYNRMKSFEIWFRRIVAIIFIGIGIYYIIINI